MTRTRWLAIIAWAKTRPVRMGRTSAGCASTDRSSSIDRLGGYVWVRAHCVNMAGDSIAHRGPVMVGIRRARLFEALDEPPEAAWQVVVKGWLGRG